MKKVMIVMALALVTTVANAASFKWSAANIYGSDGTTKWSGAVTLYCAEVASFSLATTAANGAIVAKNNEFANDAFSAGSTYNFFFKIEDGGKTFTSQSIAALAQASDSSTIQFGNMASATQTASNWTGGGTQPDVPEPTSGLLLLVGAGMLALRRKQK